MKLSAITVLYTVTKLHKIATSCRHCSHQLETLNTAQHVHMAADAIFVYDCMMIICKHAHHSPYKS